MRRPPRFLRALFRLYPQEHRRDYAEEMWEVVTHRCRGERGTGWVRAVIGSAVDLALSALRIRARRVRASVAGWRGWILDGRFVMRSVTRSPGYAATTVLVVAGAVAVHAAVLSFVRGTLLATPGYPDPDRVVVIWQSNPADGQLRDVASGPNFLDLQARASSLEAMAAFHAGSVVIVEDGRPVVYDVGEVSWEFFRAVPVEPQLGRLFDQRDRTSSAPAAIVLSDGYWRNALAADPDVVGRALFVDGEPRTVVGVLPPDFEFVMPMPLWIPLRDDVLAAESRSHIHYNLIGRLVPGASAADATRELRGIMDDLAGLYPEVEGWTARAEPLHEVSVMAVRPILWVVTAAVALVLVVALANLATLFRIRAIGREDELGVRVALGAGWSRVARVLALEIGGLSLAGAIVGLVLAGPLLARVRGMVPLWINIPESAARVPVLRATLDPWVMIVTGAIAVGGSLALAAPTLLSLRRSRSQRARRVPRGGMTGLVVAELAAATVLFLGGLLTHRAAERLLATDLGLEDRGVLTLYFGDVWARPIPEQVSYFEQVEAAVEALPSVRSAGLIDYVPFQGEDDFARFYFLDRELQAVRDVREEWRRVSPDVFETAGMRLLRGRFLEQRDLDGPPRAVVVNEAFARKHYRTGDALGSHLSTHNEAYTEMEIVGVVADVRSLGPSAPAPPMVYVPLQGDPRGTTGLYARVREGVAPAAVAETVREAIWSVDPSQPVDAIVPMSDLVERWVAIPRAVRTLVSGLAAFALVLAALGLFGVLSFAVRSRVPALGVRLALGASPARLERDFLRGSLPLLVLGIAAGLGAGVLAARVAGAVLGVEPFDAAALALTAVTVGAVGTLALYLPVRRVSSIDPTRALRAD